MTALTLARTEPAGWGLVVPFAPGAIYGDMEPVPKWSIGSPQLRRAGAGTVLCREDRLAAPLFALSYGDGIWMGVLRHAAGAGAGTTVLDRGNVEGGEVLVDRRFDFASLGGVERKGGSTSVPSFPARKDLSPTAPVARHFANTVTGAAAFTRWLRAYAQLRSHLRGERRPRN